MTAVNTPSGSFPGLVPAMKAAARDINASGGINGHPINVESCNTNTDPNQEVTCARNAVAAHAAAVVGPLLVTNPTGDLKVLQDANTVDLAGAAAEPAELQSPISFPLDGGSFTPAACLQLVKSKLATKISTVSSDIAGIKADATLVAGFAGKLGIPLASQVTLPASAPDVTSQVQQVFNGGADGVIMFALPNQGAQVLGSAAQLGKKAAFCTGDGLLPNAVLAQLGPAAANVYVASPLPPLSDTGNPAVAKFISDMKAEQASGDSAAKLDDTYSSTALRAWAGMQAFAQIAKTISGPVTNTSFLAAIKKATNVTTGIYPPINFTKPVGGSKFPSLYNAEIHLLKWDVTKKELVTTNISYNAASLAAGS